MFQGVSSKVFLKKIVSFLSIFTFIIALGLQNYANAQMVRSIETSNQKNSHHDAVNIYEGVECNPTTNNLNHLPNFAGSEDNYTPIEMGTHTLGAALTNPTPHQVICTLESGQTFTITSSVEDVSIFDTLLTLEELFNFIPDQDFEFRASGWNDVTVTDPSTGNTHTYSIKIKNDGTVQIKVNHNGKERTLNVKNGKITHWAKGKIGDISNLPNGEGEGTVTLLDNETSVSIETDENGDTIVTIGEGENATTINLNDLVNELTEKFGKDAVCSMADKLGLPPALTEKLKEIAGCGSTDAAPVTDAGLVEAKH